MQPEDPDATAEATGAKADILGALALIALGIFLFVVSWQMPRFEERRIEPSTIPGLVPMMLSGALVLLSLLLLWRATRISGPEGWSQLRRNLTSRVALRVVVSMALVLIFVFGLIGWLPFWAASTLFIFAFILTFETILADDPRPAGRTILWAGSIALVFGIGIHVGFSEIFLVRLP